MAGVARRCGDKLRPVLGEAGVLEDLHRGVCPLRADASGHERTGHLEHTGVGKSTWNVPLPVSGEKLLWSLPSVAISPGQGGGRLNQPVMTGCEIEEGKREHLAFGRACQVTPHQWRHRPPIHFCECGVVQIYRLKRIIRSLRKVWIYSTGEP